MESKKKEKEITGFILENKTKKIYKIYEAKFIKKELIISVL